MKIAGKIKNADNLEVSVKTYINNIDFEEVVFANGKIDKDGNFAFTFKIEKSVYARLHIGQEYTNIFLSDGDSLVANADMSNFDYTLKYSGKGAFNNNYLAQDVIGQFETKAMNFQINLNEQDYVKAVDSLEMESNKLFNSYEKSRFSKDFIDYITPTLKYRFIYYRWMYTIYFDGKKGKIVNREVSKDYLNFIDKVDLTEDNYADNNNYGTALMEVVYEKSKHVKDLFLADTIDKEKRKVKLFVQGYDLRKKLFKSKVLENQLSVYLKRNVTNINEFNRNTIDSIYADYLTIVKTDEYKKIIAKHFATINKFKAGSMAPTFTLQNITNKKVSLSDFNGKYIYIDFWATWCAPCLANMPDSKKLMEIFIDKKDLLFLYINIDDDKTKWKNYLKKNNPEGIHLFADKELSDELRKKYYISGIPRYVLVGKNGELINIDAPDPAFAETEIKKAIKD